MARARDEKHALAVRRPAHGRVPPRMIGQPPRHAARGRHDEDIHVAVILAGEGDERSVRRKYRVGFHPRCRGEPLGLAAVARDAPQIGRVGKHDLCPAERRVPQQQVSSLGACEPCQEEQRACDSIHKIKYRASLALLNKIIQRLAASPRGPAKCAHRLRSRPIIPNPWRLLIQPQLPDSRPSSICLFRQR